MRAKIFMILFVGLMVEALIVDRALVDEILQAIIAIGIIITAWQSYQAKLRGTANAAKLDDIHNLTNDQADKLNQITATSSKAEGVLEGRAQVQLEQASASKSEGANDGSQDRIQG